MDDENAEVVSLPQAPDAIELRHLRAFVAVADELNFGRAAARLYLSQPALSRQIRSLERLVGCDLLRRSTHRVELTLAGEALLDRARGLLREVDEAVSAAAGPRASLPGLRRGRCPGLSPDAGPGRDPGHRGR
jgi:epsilon-lactone hydrolase